MPYRKLKKKENMPSTWSSTLVFRCIQHLNLVLIHIKVHAYFWPGEGSQHLAQLLGRAFSNWILKATAILFRPVAQVNSRFTKTSSLSDPLNSRISTSRRQFNLSSSVFQFDGWPQMQPCGHSACVWNQKQINSFKINWYCWMTQKERKLNKLSDSLNT
jgi:hypothetical protein